MIQLQVSEAAALAVIEQADYFLEHSSSDLAARWEQAVTEAVQSLLNMPERGAPCHCQSPALAGLRWILVPGFDRHLIFYRYSAEDRVVLIVHVLYGGRHLESLLSDPNA